MLLFCLLYVSYELTCYLTGGATGNIRARFEQMGKQEDVRRYFVCGEKLGYLWQVWWQNIIERSFILFLLLVTSVW